MQAGEIVVVNTYKGRVFDEVAKDSVRSSGSVLNQLRRQSTDAGHRQRR